jgi:hypothetical protein
MQASKRILLLAGGVVLMSLTLTGCGAYSSLTEQGTMNVRSQQVP